MSLDLGKGLRKVAEGMSAEISREVTERAYIAYQKEREKLEASHI